jgi:hypothetical protein
MRHGLANNFRSYGYWGRLITVYGHACTIHGRDCFVGAAMYIGVVELGFFQESFFWEHRSRYGAMA